MSKCEPGDDDMVDAARRDGIEARRFEWNLLG